MSHSEDYPSLQRAATGSHPDDAPCFHEVYEIVSTVELVHDQRVYRVEILRSYTRRDDHYSSHAYMREDDGGFHRWMPLTIGGVYSDSADGAIARTIGFLRGRSHGQHH